VSTTYIAISCQLVGTSSDPDVAYGWDGTQHLTREDAHRHGWDIYDSDDFRIGVLVDGQLAGIGFGIGEDAIDFDPVEEGLPAIAAHLGLGLHGSYTEVAVGAYFADMCMDCLSGRCHWGGAESRASEEAVSVGQDYVSPKWGRCGCARHTASVAARAYEGGTLEETAMAWDKAKRCGDITVAEDDDGVVVVCGPVSGTASLLGGPFPDGS